MINVGGKQIIDVYKGTTPVDVYARNELVWRAYKDEVFYLPAAHVPGTSTWTTFHAHTLHGYGPVNVTIDYEWGSDLLQWISEQRRMRIVINGQQVGDYLFQNFTTGRWAGVHTWSNIELGIVNSFELQCYITGSADNARRVRFNSIKIERGL